MQLFNYTSKLDTNCKSWNNLFQTLQFDIPTHTLFIEDYSERDFYKKGVKVLPTVVIDNGNKSIMIESIITQKQINEAIEQLNG